MNQEVASTLTTGISIIPIQPDSKKPAIKWEPFQKRRMSTGEARQHFINGRQVALVGGAVSGNLESLDFDKPALFQPFLDTVEAVDPALRGKLTVWQHTPSGGYHILFRCSGPVGGNQKLAMSARYKDDQGKPRQDVFIETRGEGGYFLVAPSKGYSLHGSLKSLPVLTPVERDLLHGIARSFDEAGPQAPPQPLRTEHGTGDRPGDRFNRETDWRALLEAEGWTYVRTVGDRQHWTRPGKNDGSTSATLNDQGLFVFSSSSCLPTQKPLDKFAFYAYCKFNGDFKAAAQSLRVSDNSDNSESVRNFRNNQTCSDSFRHDSDKFSQPSDKSAKARELSRDVLSFIESEPAPFTNNDVYSELCARTRGEKKAIANALAYCAKTSKIRKIEGKRGHWEVIENEPEVMDLLSVSTLPFNITLPLDISDNAIVGPGSVILVSGASNAGKTVFLLRVS